MKKNNDWNIINCWYCKIFLKYSYLFKRFKYKNINKKIKMLL